MLYTSDIVYLLLRVSFPFLFTRCRALAARHPANTKKLPLAVFLHTMVFSDGAGIQPPPDSPFRSVPNKLADA